MLEMLEQIYDECEYRECPWCEIGVNVESESNVFDVDDGRESIPFCCGYCLESYIQKNEDVYQLLRKV